MLIKATAHYSVWILWLRHESSVFSIRGDFFVWSAIFFCNYLIFLLHWLTYLDFMLVKSRYLICSSGVDLRQLQLESSEIILCLLIHYTSDVVELHMNFASLNFIVHLSNLDHFCFYQSCITSSSAGYRTRTKRGHTTHTRLSGK